MAVAALVLILPFIVSSNAVLCLRIFKYFKIFQNIFAMKLRIVQGDQSCNLCIQTNKNNNSHQTPWVLLGFAIKMLKPYRAGANLWYL